tara:strand:+ start:777 stop:1637 length:861 start_codon:yes stop_codon:yes gene_type:complete
MISIIGIGNGASAIAEKFSEIPQYDVYLMNDSIAKKSKYKFKLKKYAEPEDYEKNIPDVKKFFENIRDHVQVFIVGSSYSSNYALGILEQIKDKKIEIFYVKPDTDLLTGLPRMLETAAFGILQQYARSGLFDSMTIFSNQEIEKTLGNVPIKNYYDTINNAIFSAVHYLNYFIHTEPEIGQVSKPSEISRIRTLGALNLKNLEENWFFELDIDRELCYYMCINEEKLKQEGTLHRRIVDMLKKKNTNAFRKISYAIYETPHQDFGYVVAHTNAIQQNTLDKIDQG